MIAQLWTACRCRQSPAPQPQPAAAPAPPPAEDLLGMDDDAAPAAAAPQPTAAAPVNPVGARLTLECEYHTTEGRVHLQRTFLIECVCHGQCRTECSTEYRPTADRDMRI